MRTLTCSGKRKHHGMDCYSIAVWAVKKRDGSRWHGACHHHSHQILKWLGGDGAELEVRLATAVVEELDRVAHVRETATRAETMVSSFRPLVQDTECTWTTQRSVDVLVRNGHLPPPADAAGLQDARLLARELLELLCGEGVLEHQGEEKYEPVGPLPHWAPDL